MRQSKMLLTACLLLAWCVPVSAQQEEDESRFRLSRRAENIIGAPVYNYDDEELGEIDSLIIDQRTGRVRYAVLGVGGFLGIGERQVAVPWQALQREFDEQEDETVYLLDADERQLRQAPEFNEDKWDTMAGSDDWTSEIDAFFNVRQRERSSREPRQQEESARQPGTREESYRQPRQRQESTGRFQRQPADRQQSQRTARDTQQRDRAFTFEVTIPEYFDQLDLSSRQRQQLHEIAQQYHSPMAELWAQINRLHWDLVELQTRKLQAMEDALDEDQAEQLRQVLRSRVQQRFGRQPIQQR